MVKGRVGTKMALRKPGRSFTQSEEEGALVFLETHFLEDEIKTSESLKENLSEDYRRSMEEIVSMAKHIFSSERIKWAINTFSAFKTPMNELILLLF